MPELPEVETSCRGIEPFLTTKCITDIIIREPRLRWPIPGEIQDLKGQIITSVVRRGKYILLNSKVGTALIHLGMSGKLRILPMNTLVQKHDHVDIIIENKLCLRFNDPRRFGCLLWVETDPYHHPLLSKLGLEPLTSEFDGKYLFDRSRQSSRAVKLFIMDSHIVVGVGNIYANEALFMAGINPSIAAGKVSVARYTNLANAIKAVLQQAIVAGGTTLKDFQASDGKPGYFQQKLKVYGRENEPCLKCHRPLVQIRLNQRATVYCSHCQIGNKN